MTTRSAAVAGRFYPGDPGELTQLVDGMLRTAVDARVGAAPRRPKALITPHAGYVYSGPIAATAYSLFTPDPHALGAPSDAAPQPIERVILLGPAHRVYVDGLAAPSVDAFQTPLGDIPIDPMIRTLGDIRVNDEAHAQEHSLEVHLPFLQRALGRFSLIPLVVGRARREQVAAVLEACWGSDETLVVISSDLSHFLPYEKARGVDQDTADRIVARRPTLSPDQACGAHPVNGLLEVAQKLPLQAELLDLRNSGDTQGPRDQVVGYGSFAFYESQDAGRANIDSRS